MPMKPGQRKCVETLDRPIVVAAGAGSGKTFTLTKRIVGAVQSGYVDDIGQVCAITFTNKAAAELKSRVKAELRACGLVEQSLKADDAWISTIHGMCARILRAHAVELDLDPSFQMADGTLVDRLRNQAVEEVLEAAEAGDTPDASAAAALFSEYGARRSGFSSATVEGMLLQLIELAGADVRGVDAFLLPEFDVSPTRLVQTVLECFDDLLQAADAEKPNNSRDEWMARTSEALANAHEAADGGVADALQGLRAVSSLATTKRFGSKAFKARVDEAAQTVNACIMELRLAAATPHLRTLVHLAADALERFNAKKRHAGVLDNNDLLVLAARALEEHPAIAADYADRFRLVMVDEFQDTDQMQVDMIKRIAGPGASRLCTVGDAQQSIYRFRGADVSVYRRHLESVRAADPDNIIMLPDNFRSHADVLSLVDRVFERPDMFGGEFMSLAPGRDESQVKRSFPAGGPRVVVQQTTKAYTRGVPAEEVTRVQAQRIAAAFAELRRAGHPAGDMAVLLGRMKNAGVYAQALREQGLACVVSGGSVFSETPEAQMVLRLAQVAANPADTDSLLAVLTGPLFRVTDDDLLALATRVDDAGTPRRRALDAGLRAFARAFAMGEDGGEEVADASPQLRHATRVLGNLGRDAVRRSMADALMRAVVDSGWVSRLQAAGPEGLAAAGNVYKAIRIVEDLEAAEELGPVGAAKALAATLACAKEAPGALSAEGGDFVRIMTVHASKGLEFPIVAVGEFKDVRGDSSRLLALPGDAGIALSLDLGRSLDRIGGAARVKPQPMYQALLEGIEGEDALKERAFAASGALERRAAMSWHSQLGDEEEAKRLLYVALTRAREFLVVSLGGARTKDNPNGLPKNCLAAVANALEASGAGFEPGATSYPFGGQAPAMVEHVALVKEEAPAAEGAALAGETPAGETPAGEAPAAVPAVAAVAPATFDLPVIARRPRVIRVPYRDAHEGVFSYSSVSEASHAGDLLERLAARFWVSCDAAAPFVLPPEDAPDSQVFRAEQRWADLLAAMGEDDDGSWAYLPGDAADDDKATDLGTAFHRLAQCSVDAWAGQGPLVPPPPARVRGLVRACKLDGRQWTRLDEALARWFGSDEAAEMVGWDALRAEVPFMMPVRLPAEAGDEFATVFLEGEIDLLAVDGSGQRARVVDYKTGGHPDETPETLRCKHVLQASCYAYSLLMQGVQEVEASFVRVERGRADDPSQPQCVIYRFTAADRDVLEHAIAQAYRQDAANAPG